MNPVLRLFENLGKRGFEYIVRHLKRPDRLRQIRLVIMKRRQAVEEYCLPVVQVTRLAHEIHIDLVRPQQFKPFIEFRLLTHGHPDIRIQDVGAFHGLHRIG